MLALLDPPALPISESLSALVRTTLEEQGFDAGLLLVAGKEAFIFSLAVTVGCRSRGLTRDELLTCLRQLPDDMRAVCPVDMLPNELQPGFAIPLLVEGRLVGILLGMRFRASSSVQPLGAGCQLLSLATHSMLLEWQTEHHMRQLQVISKVNEQIAALIARDSKLEAVVQLVQETFSFYHVSILLFDPDTLQLRINAAAGMGARELTAKEVTFLQEERGLVSWVARHGQPIVVNDVSAEERYHPLQTLPATASEMVVPIQIDGKTIGVLDVQSEQLGAFDRVDLLALQIVANQIGNALDHTSLLQQERSRREMLQVLQETTRTISSSLELDRVLDVILEELGRVVSYDHVRLKRVDGDVARVIAARGFSNLRQVMGTTYRVSGNTLASLIVYEKQAINIPDILKDPRWLWLPGTSAVCSWIGIPLVIKERAIGLLSVSREEYRPFSQEEMEIVASFASHAAIAIENARLYYELKQFSATLEKSVQKRTAELEHAREELAAVLNREVEVQEKERIRIANELHDSVIQVLIATNFQLESIKSRAVPQHEATLGQLKRVQLDLDTLVAEIKAIVHDLRPPALESLGLAHALRQLVAGFQVPGLQAELHVAGSVKPLKSSAERTVYRVVQEALANARRHSGATQVKVVLSFQPECLETLVEDNGCGFDVAAAGGKGLGLLTMRDRARSSGGMLETRSRQGEGTRITMNLPAPFIPLDE